MRPFTFHPGPRLIAGEALHDRLPAAAPGWPMPVRHRRRRARPRSGRSPSATRWKPVGRLVTVFDRVEADPSKETLLAAVQRAAGRGDLSRSASAAAARWMSPSSPLICSAPATTSTRSGASMSPRASGCRWCWCRPPPGTGSEATPISVITCEGGMKLAVNARPLTADWAVLDADLTLGLPGHVTAATGIDAIVHAVEAYTSARLKNPLSDALAREALRLLTSNLLTACHEPRQSRSALGDAARRASGRPCLCQCAGRAASMPWPIRWAALYHLPHGLTNALMLRQCSHIMPRRRASFTPSWRRSSIRIAKQGSQAARRGLIDTSRRAGCRRRGVSLAPARPRHRRRRRRLLASEAMKQTRLLVNNPCAIEEADARRLYEAAW